MLLSLRINQRVLTEGEGGPWKLEKTKVSRGVGDKKRKNMHLQALDGRTKELEVFVRGW